MARIISLLTFRLSKLMPSSLSDSPTEPGRTGGTPLPEAQEGSAAFWKARENWLGLALTLCIVGLHVLRALHAGGLWRDETATANLADHFSFARALKSSQHEIFPVLLPLTAHAYSGLMGTSDQAMRGLGMIIGVAAVAALWFSMFTVRRTAPLLSLALLGLNPAFLQWGDSLRGYGLGIFFLLLTTGLVWRMLERPNALRFSLAALAAVAAVQALFNNSVFVLVICAAASVVALRNRQIKLGGAALLIGMPAALSLLPYAHFVAARETWDIVVKVPFTVADFRARLGDALAQSGWGDVWAAGLMLAGACVLAIRAQFRKADPAVRPHRDLLLFCSVALCAGPLLYFVFLNDASYPTQAWYYLPLMALTALLLDLIAASCFQAGWRRLARPCLAVLLAAVGLLPAWKQAHVRQTNLDLVAAELNHTAHKQDLIVVSPWYLGITFQRYYSGAAPWVTIPPMSDHSLHRYDLVKENMLLPNQDQPVQPVLKSIADTLKTGGRVWTVGEVPIPSPHEHIPSLSPAPDPKWKWSDRMYTLIWSEKVGANLGRHAGQSENVSLGHAGPVNPFEEAQLVRYEGWRE